MSRGSLSSFPGLGKNSQHLGVTEETAAKKAKGTALSLKGESDPN